MSPCADKTEDAAKTKDAAEAAETEPLSESDDGKKRPADPSCDAGGPSKKTREDGEIGQRGYHPWFGDDEWVVEKYPKILTFIKPLWEEFAWRGKDDWLWDRVFEVMVRAHSNGDLTWHGMEISMPWDSPAAFAKVFDKTLIDVSKGEMPSHDYRRIMSAFSALCLKCGIACPRER